MTAMLMLAAAAASTVAPPQLIGQAAAQATSTALGISKPAGTLQNDLLVAVVSWADSYRVITPPAGWTLQSDKGLRIGIYSKVAGGSEGSSYTFTANGSVGLSGVIYTYRRALFGWVSDGYSGAVSPSVPPGVDLPAYGGMLFAAYTNSGASVSFATPSGFTSLTADADATAPSLAVFSKTSSAALAAAVASSASTGGSAGANVGLQFCILPSAPARDVPALVASSTNATTSAGTSITCSKPAGALPGDLLVCLLAQNDNDTVTDAHGFTEALDSGGQRVAWKILDGSEPSTFTFTLSTTSLAVVDLLLFRGAVFDSISTQRTTSASQSVNVDYVSPGKNFALEIIHFVVATDTASAALTTTWPDAAWKDLVAANADANAPNRWVVAKRRGKEASPGSGSIYNGNVSAVGARRSVAFTVVNSAY